MKCIACVVEGHGEVAAVPNLVARILLYLNATEWRVHASPFRQPRGRLVRGVGASRQRKYESTAIDGIAAAARARHADAIIVLCDSDDDCAARWGPVIADAIQAQALPGGAVMIVREYEAWLLTGFNDAELMRIGVRDVERVRDAKGRLSRLRRDYLPTQHQLALTRRIDIDRARQMSASFDKLVRVVAQITSGGAPPA